MDVEMEVVTGPKFHDDDYNYAHTEKEQLKHQ